MLMNLFAWLAATLVFASLFMRTIVPLRILAIASNVAFIGYGLLGVREGVSSIVLPILLLHLALLPLNIVRLLEVTRVSKAMRNMDRSSVPFDFLVPFMKDVAYPSGHKVFRRGDSVDDVYIVKSGTVSLTELGKQLGPGSIFGEVAVFSDKALRTATAECRTDCTLYKISGDKVLELFYQDRNFAFRIARLLAGYAGLTEPDPLALAARQSDPVTQLGAAGENYRP
jgi:hypothetical protein